MTDTKSLLDSSPTYEFLFRTTADGLIIADADGLIRHINPAAAAMLSVTHDEAVGKKPNAVFPTNQALINLFIRAGEQKLDVRLPRQRLAQGIAESFASGERIVLLQDV